jgi:hypothetical protein
MMKTEDNKINGSFLGVMDLHSAYSLQNWLYLGDRHKFIHPRIGTALRCETPLCIRFYWCVRWRSIIRRLGKHFMHKTSFLYCEFKWISWRVHIILWTNVRQWINCVPSHICIKKLFTVCAQRFSPGAAVAVAGNIHSLSPRLGCWA